ncbi:hypothetical protein ALP03_200211 [Pseudomonas amygdali pv. tabaci]|uniref:Uncharacterized protein n=1 Tax=Pseudomonas amygdali pv. tabaci TaxID=322 RepID=A0A3M6GMV9_PSEAJ|nr:hypothetical protein ALP03_200211 [Pseudomonas amygdali pv. tabaci]
MRTQGIKHAIPLDIYNYLRFPYAPSMVSLFSLNVNAVCQLNGLSLGKYRNGLMTIDAPGLRSSAGLLHPSEV